MPLTTIFNDTFTGTAGAALTGLPADTTENGSDVYATFAPFPSLVYATGGGATSATFSSGAALSTYPLSGAPDDLTVSVQVRFNVAGSVALLQMRRSHDGSNSLAVSLDSVNQIIAVDQAVAGTTTRLSSPAFAWQLGTNYIVTATPSGTSLTVTVFDGTTTTTVISGLTVATGDGSEVLIGQSGATPGAITFTGFKAQVTASATVTGVTVSPAGPVYLPGGLTQQYSATVAGTGSPSQAVTWSFTTGGSGGSITTGGLFTAPAATSTTQTFEVGATSVQDGTTAGFSAIIVPPLPTTSTFSGPGTGTVGTPDTFSFSLNSIAPGPGTPVTIGGSTGGTLASVAGHGSVAGTVLTIPAPAPSGTPGTSSGQFTFGSSTPGTYILTPTATGITFTPPTRTYVVTANTATLFSLALTGATSGPANRPSGNFEVTPNGVYTGTFTPNSASGVAYSPATLTWAGDSSSKTFTATRATPGTVSVDGTCSPVLTPPNPISYTFLSASISASPASIPAGANTTVTFTGVNTTWTTSPPTLLATGVAGVSIGSVTVLSDTSATATVTTSSSTGTESYTDAITGATTTQSVATVPTGGELEAYYPLQSLSTLYFVITRAPGQAWNGSGFEAMTSANWTNYAIAGSDAGGVGIYTANFPRAIPPGTYTIYGYAQVGGSKAPSDSPIGSERDAAWDGTTLSEGSGGGTGSGAPGITMDQLNTALTTAFANYEDTLATVDEAASATWNVASGIVFGETPAQTLGHVRAVACGTSSDAENVTTYNNPDGTPNIAVERDESSDRITSTPA